MNYSTPVDEIFRRLQNNKDHTLGVLQESLDALDRAAVIPFLRAKGQIQLFNPADQPHEQAAKAAFCAGYQEALDDIMYFVQRFIIPGEEAARMRVPNLDYGATNKLIREGRITSQEAEMMRNKTQ